MYPSWHSQELQVSYLLTSSAVSFLYFTAYHASTMPVKDVLFTNQGRSPFLGAFATFRKATITFVMSVCPPARPPVCKQQLGFHWTDLDKI
jgi:hypothetical protein